MAFLDKLNNFASVAGEKASGALEIGKLNLRLNTEERKIETATASIGACMLCNLDAGQEYDEAIMSFYEDIKVGRATIASIRAEIATVSGIMVCPACAAKNPAGSKFCRECGNKLVAEDPVEPVTVEIVETFCPNCNAAVKADEAFCTQCGHQLHEN